MKAKLREVIFGTHTRAGRNFDLILLVLILASVLVVMVESIPSWREKFGESLHVIEWCFTILFTIEYLVRVLISEKPLNYIRSVWGIIDLLSILPSFISPLFTGYTSLRAIRAFRLLRIFRILNLSRFTSEARALSDALKASYYKIMVFFFFVSMLMIFTGTVMYVIEGGQNGFDSIPESIYWAITTTTTVGYGDITPVTGIGKVLASIMMITGYAIIAVPTGLITAQVVKPVKENEKKRCSSCKEQHSEQANFCSN